MYAAILSVDVISSFHMSGAVEYVFLEGWGGQSGDDYYL